MKLECLSYALPIFICFFSFYFFSIPLAFSAGEEENREVQPYDEESVSSSPSLPARSPWGWASSELMAAVKPFLSRNAHNQNILGEGAAPPQAAAPAEVPQADLEPSESEGESSSSLEKTNGKEERGRVAEAVENQVPVPRFRIARQMEESSLYERIRQLEASCGYLIPPQMEEGEYLRSVKSALNEDAELGLS